MSPEVFAATLDELMMRQPFRVFAIELHGGRRVEIDHRKAVVRRDGAAVFVAPGGIPIWFDHDSVTQIIGAPAHAVPPEREASDGK